MTPSGQGSRRILVLCKLHPICSTDDILPCITHPFRQLVLILNYILLIIKILSIIPSSAIVTTKEENRGTNGGVIVEDSRVTLSGDGGLGVSINTVQGPLLRG